MLEPVRQLARRTRQLRRIVIGVGVLGGLAAGVGLLAFSGREGDALVMPGLLTMLWAALLLIGIEILSHLPRAHGDASAQDLPLRRAFVVAVRWMMVGALVVLGATAVEVSLYIADRWLLPAELDEVG